MKIIGISGKKQAGKNTAANILHGLVLTRYGLIKDWAVGYSGELLVLTNNRDGKMGWGELDVSRKDKEFIEYAEVNMWPFVKLYNFADTLKWMCTELFEIPHECIWGTDEQKNRLMPHLLWENMPGVTTEKTPQDPVNEVVAGRLGKYYEKVLSGIVYHEPGPMTARQFMQFLGTEIGRKMYASIWVNATIKKIKREQSELAIIADVRFPNEAKAIEDADGMLLRLTRNVFDDKHDSETSLDNYCFQHVIDNDKYNIFTYAHKITQFYDTHIGK